MSVSLVRWFRSQRQSTASRTTDLQQPGTSGAPVQWLDLFPSEDGPAEHPSETLIAHPAAPSIGRRRWHVAAGVTIALLLLTLLTTVGDITSEPPRSTSDSGASAADPVAARVVPPESSAAPPVTSSAPPAREPRVANEALVRRDRLAIQGVLNRYRDAMSTLDVGGVRSVWPGVHLEAVRSGFSRLAEQNVEFESCRISSAESRATATCVGVVESGFSTGKRRPNVARTRWQFTLQKSGTRWMITAIDTEPA
jgi:hypothetical protein